MNLLFTCAGRRNYLINYFKEALNGEGRILAADMQKSAPAMIDADDSFAVPEIYDSNYIATIEKIIIQEKIDAVISLNDLELPILSENRKRLESLGCKVIVSDSKAINICFDKWETNNFLEHVGINYPKTFIDLSEAKKSIKKIEISFPLVIKPRWGSASIGIDFPADLRELELSYELQSLKLKRTILAEASNEHINRSILIQEKLGGVEYGMDILNDLDGNYIRSFVRKKLAMRSGETDKAVSIIDNRFEEIGRTIGENLKHIGNLDCDIFEYNNQLYVLELNPRFGGGYPFSHEAGVNTAAIYIEWIKGNKDISKHLNYKEGIAHSKCDRLIRIN